VTSESLPATIAAAVEYKLEAKKSVFLARLTPVQSVTEADAVVAAIRKKHWDAGHNCTALVVGPHADRQRSNDDGEPGGTAGAPMLDVLRHRNVTDLVAVVTRWFGGTLLGAGGLVRAYGSAVSGALNEATMVDRVYLTRVSAHAPHADAGRVLAFLHLWAADHGAILDEPVYAQDVTLAVRVPPPLVERLQADTAALTAGEVAVIAGETEICDLRRR